MSEDLLKGFGEPRIGLTRDPCWDEYRRWEWDRFPLRFPVCTASVSQRPIDDQAAAVVRWELDAGVTLVGRTADGNGRLLLEVLPRPREPTGSGRKVVATLRLAGPELPARIGIGFDWVFFAPVRRFQPTHPLGVVIADADRLRGFDTVIAVTDTGHRPPEVDADRRR